MYPTPRAGLAAAAMWLGFAATGIAAPAQAAAPGPAPAAGITAPAQAAGPAPAAAAPAASGEATLIPANGRPIALEVGGGTLIRLPRAANTVFVANPDIADVQVKSPTLVYVSAKSPGQTVIYAVDANDQVLLNAAIRVAFDLSQFRRSLNQLVPGNAISVSQIDFEPGAERRRRQRRAGAKSRAPSPSPRSTGEGTERQSRQPPLGRHPEPGRSPGPHRRGRPQNLETDRR